MRDTNTNPKETKMTKVTITLSSGRQTSEMFLNAEQAYAARDRALDLGFTQVRIDGLPTTTWGTQGDDDQIIELS